VQISNSISLGALSVIVLSVTLSVTVLSAATAPLAEGIPADPKEWRPVLTGYKKATTLPDLFTKQNCRAIISDPTTYDDAEFNRSICVNINTSEVVYVRDPIF